MTASLWARVGHEVGLPPAATGRPASATLSRCGLNIGFLLPVFILLPPVFILSYYPPLFSLPPKPQCK